MNKKFSLALTAQAVQDALLSIDNKIDTSDVVQNLQDPATDKVPSAKAVADSLAVVSGDFGSLGSLAFDSVVNLSGSKATGTLPINKGGTGGTTAQAARTALGVLSESQIDTKIEEAIPEIQTVDLSGSQVQNQLPITSGGTGASSQSQARSNLSVDSTLEVTEKTLRRAVQNAGKTWKGYFSLGFEITSYDHIGVDGNGDFWEYIGNTIPFTVPASLNPIADNRFIPWRLVSESKLLETRLTDMGLNNVGNFKYGVTFDGENDVAIFGGEAYEYVGSSSYPVVVSAGTDPTSDTSSFKKVETGYYSATKALLQSLGLSGNFGFFNKGFTYTEEGDVGIDDNNQFWIYNGGLPFEVANGTVPSEPDYSVFDHTTAVGAHDDIYRRKTTVQEISTGAFNVGTQVVVTDRGSHIFEILSGGTPTGYGTLNAGVGKTAKPVNKSYVSLTAYGVVYDGQEVDYTDNTDAVHEALADATSLLTYVLSDGDGTSFAVRGLDFTNEGSKLIASDGTEYRKTNIIIKGPVLVTNASGESCAVLVNDSELTTVRGSVLENLAIQEGNSSDENLGRRKYGIYAKGAPQTKFDNVLTAGFDVGASCGYMWNCDADSLQLYNYREYGFQCNAGSLNGFNIGSLHCSSNDASAIANLDARICNTLNIGTFTTEGLSAAHIAVSANTRNVTIASIHAEGTKDLITVDVDTSSPTTPFGSVTIIGGTIFNAGGVGAKVVKKIGSATGVGLANLTLLDVGFQKTTTTEKAYFDLSDVANFHNGGRFEPYLTDSLIDSYTWHNLGENISRTFQKSLVGNSGLVSSPFNKGLYTGMPDEELSYKNYNGADIATTKKLLNLELGIESAHEIDVSVEYNSGAFSTRRFWARFIVLQTIDNTIVQELIASHDLYALDCTFSMTGGELLVENPTGFGVFFFRIKSSKNLRG